MLRGKHIHKTIISDGCGVRRVRGLRRLRGVGGVRGLRWVRGAGGAQVVRCPRDGDGDGADGVHGVDAWCCCG